MGKPFIHDHDGHVDDLVASILLWLAPEADLQAIGVSDGHCVMEQAFECLIKIATYLDLEGPEIAMGDELLFNPFREAWRKESFVMNSLPLFSENSMKKPYSQGRRRPSNVVYFDCLSHSKDPVTFVTTGPVTNIAHLLSDRSNLAEKIEQIFVMGGAVNVPGDVHEEGYEGTAEWNVFADPKAFKILLDSRVPIKLIPLDAGNQVLTAKTACQKIEKQAQDSKASRLARALYGLVSGFDYHLYDALTALTAVDPSMVTFRKMRIDVVTSGKSLGKTAKSLFGGREIEVATSVDNKKFEEKFLALLSKK